MPTTCPTGRRLAPSRSSSCPTRSTPTTCDSRRRRGFNTGEQFYTYLKDAFDALYAEGAAGSAKMLNIGSIAASSGAPPLGGARPLPRLRAIQARRLGRHPRRHRPPLARPLPLSRDDQPAPHGARGVSRNVRRDLRALALHRRARLRARPRRGERHGRGAGLGARRPVPSRLPRGASRRAACPSRPCGAAGAGRRPHADSSAEQAPPGSTA